METASESAKAEKETASGQDHEHRSDPRKKPMERSKELPGNEGYESRTSPPEGSRMFRGGRGRSHAPRAQVTGVPVAGGNQETITGFGETVSGKCPWELSPSARAFLVCLDFPEPAHSLQPSLDNLALLQ